MKNGLALAVGDGGNDVSMLKQSDIGIAINNQYDSQALNASDFVVNKFEDIKRLIFYHGREFYRKNAYLIIFCFYKNFYFVFFNIYYNVYANFSGATFYIEMIG